MELGLPPRYFHQSSSEDIALHIQCLLVRLECKRNVIYAVACERNMVVLVVRLIAASLGWFVCMLNLSFSQKHGGVSCEADCSVSGFVRALYCGSF